MAVLPAQAGVVRRPRSKSPAATCSSPAGGGGPIASQWEVSPVTFFPRRRGWSDRLPVGGQPCDVLPAQAGVVRPRPVTPGRRGRSSRAGGGGPSSPSMRSPSRRFFPRRRGWSGQRQPSPSAAAVLPAQAGVVPGRQADFVRAAAFFPRRRGWSGRGRAHRRPAGVLPAQAGVVRRTSKAARKSYPFFPRRRGWSAGQDQGGVARAVLPRAGGGGPSCRVPSCGSTRFFPRRRGWSVGVAGVGHIGTVLPAQAGVVRCPHRKTAGGDGSSRAGGGGPFAFVLALVLGLFFPRRRGWSRTRSTSASSRGVLPAQAGVVRPALPGPPDAVGSSRAGGGGPRPRCSRPPRLWFFPRRRGWSASCDGTGPGRGVLPAQAGVVRARTAWPPLGRRSSRAGGGGPLSPAAVEIGGTFFPRRRGWSASDGARPPRRPVLPAQAGVVRRPPGSNVRASGSSRAGGGGPTPAGCPTRSSQFFPRRRGWSGSFIGGVGAVLVLPAQAGVVRMWRVGRGSTGRSSRAGGGGPSARLAPVVGAMFFPRRRGWSDRDPDADQPGVVLPAQAGVVRGGAWSIGWRRGSSRAGGGGPWREQGLDLGRGFFPRRRGWSDAVGDPRQEEVVLPRRRGWSGPPRVPRWVDAVLPAQAGVVRTGGST